MYTLIKNLSVKKFMLYQAPTIVGSLAIAEIFYKFGSFLLEAVAFLATWFVLDVFVAALARGLGQADRQPD